MTGREWPLMWTVKMPEVWPSPPAEMTISALAEIEVCPRRWALSSADYPLIWSRRGYPQRFQIRTIGGTALHIAVERITKQLILAQCPAINHPDAIKVIKSLGGYSRIVTDAINSLLLALADNPRASSLLEHAERALRGRVPELRARVQSVISRLRLPAQDPQASSPAKASTIISKDVAQPIGIASRRPLESGIYAEIELRAPSIGWKGKADLLLLSPTSCEIGDFKTGDPKDMHQLQIRTYALLWNRDRDLNPAGRYANSLRLIYNDADVEVAGPSDEELVILEKDLVVRGNAARQAVVSVPPLAKPSPDHCGFCHVRQLCDAYWTFDTQQMMGADKPAPAFADMELTLLRRHGPSSWDVRVELSAKWAPGTNALLRTTSSLAVRPGDRLRITDASVAFDEAVEHPILVVTAGTFSEIFRIERLI